MLDNHELNINYCDYDFWHKQAALTQIYIWLKRMYFKHFPFILLKTIYHLFPICYEDKKTNGFS